MCVCVCAGQCIHCQRLANLRGKSLAGRDVGSCSWKSSSARLVSSTAFESHLHRTKNKLTMLLPVCLVLATAHCPTACNIGQRNECVSCLVTDTQPTKPTCESSATGSLFRCRSSASVSATQIRRAHAQRSQVGSQQTCHIRQPCTLPRLPSTKSGSLHSRFGIQHNFLYLQARLFGQVRANLGLDTNTSLIAPCTLDAT